MKKESKAQATKKAPAKNNYVCMTENAVNNAYDGDVSSVMVQPRKKHNQTKSSYLEKDGSLSRD